MKKILKTKVQRLIYLILLLWLLMGGTALILAGDFSGLTHFFLALSGFVSSYIFAELFRPSVATPIFTKGRTSKRELMIYVVIIMWTIIGFGGLWFAADLAAIATYFAALIPFVDLYILGDTFRPEETNEFRKNLIKKTNYLDDTEQNVNNTTTDSDIVDESQEP